MNRHPSTHYLTDTPCSSRRGEANRNAVGGTISVDAVREWQYASPTQSRPLKSPRLRAAFFRHRRSRSMVEQRLFDAPAGFTDASDRRPVMNRKRVLLLALIVITISAPAAATPISAPLCPLDPCSFEAVLNGAAEEPANASPALGSAHAFVIDHYRPNSGYSMTLDSARIHRSLAEPRAPSHM